MYIQEARAVHARNQSKNQKNLGEEDKHFIEKQRIRALIQERTQEHFKEKGKLEEEIDEVQKKLGEATLHKRKIKKGLESIKKNLIGLYKNILKDGMDTRKDGLRWVIKAIWAMDEPIPISTFPNFLDGDSIYYLLQIAKLELDLDAAHKKLAAIKQGFQSQRSFSPVRVNSHDLWNHVQRRIRGISRSIVVGRTYSMNSSAIEKSVEESISLDEKRTKAHHDLQVYKEKTSRLNREIHDLSSS